MTLGTEIPAPNTKVRLKVWSKRPDEWLKKSLSGALQRKTECKDEPPVHTSKKSAANKILSQRCRSAAEGVAFIRYGISQSPFTYIVALNLIFLFPDFGAVIEQYNQF